VWKYWAKTVNLLFRIPPKKCFSGHNSLLRYFLLKPIEINVRKPDNYIVQWQITSAPVGDSPEFSLNQWAQLYRWMANVTDTVLRQGRVRPIAKAPATAGAFRPALGRRAGRSGAAA
jgi:hypothetical protein